MGEPTVEGCCATDDDEEEVARAFFALPFNTGVALVADDGAVRLRTAAEAAVPSVRFAEPATRTVAEPGARRAGEDDAAIAVTRRTGEAAAGARAVCAALPASTARTPGK